MPIAISHCSPPSTFSRPMQSEFERCRTVWYCCHSVR